MGVGLLQFINVWGKYATRKPFSEGYRLGRHDLEGERAGGSRLRARTTVCKANRDEASLMLNRGIVFGGVESLLFPQLVDAVASVPPFVQPCPYSSAGLE